jgi:hypothetical protein
MKNRSLGLKLVGAAFAAGALLSAATVTPVQAQPDRCRAEAWVFCDPYFARTTPEWQACVADYIANCQVDIPGPCNPWGWPVGCVANKTPKASKDSIVKMLQGQKSL